MTLRDGPDLSNAEGFRHRGHAATSRIESFSDAVFGFSTTLLVVSLQVPKTFDDLLRTLGGFPAFALTFALLAQIWYLQNRFFRRYALQDPTTVFLNLVLLFVIVFFTYPLKFLFSFAAVGGASIRAEQIVPMYATYALGYAAIFVLIALMYAHAYRRRDDLELTPIEAAVTRHSIVLALYQILVAAISVATAAVFHALGDDTRALAGGGFAYVLVPIGVRCLKVLEARRRRREHAVSP